MVFNDMQILLESKAEKAKITMLEFCRVRLAFYKCILLFAYRTASLENGNYNFAKENENTKKWNHDSSNTVEKRNYFMTSTPHLHTPATFVYTYR